MKYTLLIPSVLVVCLGLSLALRAGQLDPPAGPVNATGRFGTRVDILTLPGDPTATHVISQPGSYYLSGNLQSTAGLHGIRVHARDVTIDLNGYSIDCNGGNGVQDGSGSGGRLVIKNGSLFNGFAGIQIGLAEMVIVEDVTVQDCANTGINLNIPGRGGIVRNCHALSNTDLGISASGANMVIMDCVSRNNGIYGIRTTGSSLISNCLSLGSGTDDIRVANGMVRGCVASTIVLDGGSTGIENHQP